MVATLSAGTNAGKKALTVLKYLIDQFEFAIKAGIRYVQPIAKLIKQNFNFVIKSASDALR